MPLRRRILGIDYHTLFRTYIGTDAANYAFIRINGPGLGSPVNGKSSGRAAAGAAAAENTSVNINVNVTPHPVKLGTHFLRVKAGRRPSQQIGQYIPQHVKHP